MQPLLIDPFFTATTKATAPRILLILILPMTTGHKLQQRIPNHLPTNPTPTILLIMAHRLWATFLPDRSLRIPLTPTTSRLTNILLPCHQPRRRFLLRLVPHHRLHIPRKAAPASYQKVGECKLHLTRLDHGHN